MNSHTTSQTQTILIAMAASLALVGCASYDSAGYDAEVGQNNSPDDSLVDASTAQARLYEHDIAGAQAEFLRLKQQGGGRDGRPAVGVAVTTLLLLPYSVATTRIVTSHLGARDAINRQGDVLWGDQGLAYFIARGVAWEDSPQTAGIKTLLVDRLPWSRQQLDTIDGFVDGLNAPVTFLANDLAPLAAELGKISDDLAIATADEEFETFFLPGQVFHDESLDLTLGKSELSLLRGALQTVEAGLHFFAAYEHAWTLERGFGTSVWSPVIDDPMDAEHVAGAEAIDYQVAHMNESLGRAIASEARLGDAADAAAKAFRSFADAVEFGVSESVDSTLDWGTADQLVASKFAEFLRALATSVEDGPTDLPFTEPAQSADLAAFFDGRTVGPEAGLLAVDRYDDGISLVAEVVLNEDAYQAFIDGVFTPPFDAEPAPELTIADDVERMIDAISSDIAADVERSVNGSF